jgi:hypothetical protein
MCAATITLEVPNLQKGVIENEYGVVPGAGIEPAHLSVGDFESPASTNFTTRAGF